jgi:hypothetical protein
LRGEWLVDQRPERLGRLEFRGKGCQELQSDTIRDDQDPGCTP